MYRNASVEQRHPPDVTGLCESEGCLVYCLQVMVFFGHVGFCPCRYELVNLREKVFIFSLGVEEDEKMGEEVGVGYVREDVVSTVNGCLEGLAVANADLEKGEEGEYDFSLFVRGAAMEGEKMGDLLLGGTPELGASLDAIIFDGVEEEGLAVGLETKGKKVGHGAFFILGMRHRRIIGNIGMVGVG